MKNKIKAFFIVFLIIVLVIRIYYVNKNKHLPVLIEAAQGEKIEYCRVDYSIDSAVLWEYDDFFQKNQQYMYFKDKSRGSANTKMLVVKLRFEKNSEHYGEEAYIADSVPVTYVSIQNWTDPELEKAMNQYEDANTTGIYTLPYEIYKEYFTEEKWNDVDKMEFRLVFGTYPERKELIISNYEVDR